jgi:TonB family protein
MKEKLSAFTSSLRPHPFYLNRASQVLTHELFKRAGRLALILVPLILVGGAASPAFAQGSGAGFDPRIQLYPRASFLQRATERLWGMKASTWLFEAAYGTDDSLKEVVKHFKAQAQKFNGPKPANPVIQALLRDNWKTKETTVRGAPTVFGVGDAFKASIAKAESSFGIIMLDDSFVRVHLMSPRPADDDANKLVGGTMIVLIWERPAPQEDPAAGGGGQQEEDKVYSPREVTRKARITSRTDPEYTSEASLKGIGGLVIIRAVFRSSGEVTNIRVVQGLPYGLTEEAVKAARKIKFEPAVKDGRYVSQYIQIEYSFHPF